MTYSVYARDRKSGREYALPNRYFGNFSARIDAEIALAWYMETSSGSARELVDVYIFEHAPELDISVEVAEESENSFRPDRVQLESDICKKSRPRKSRGLDFFIRAAITLKAWLPDPQTLLQYW